MAHSTRIPDARDERAGSRKRHRLSASAAVAQAKAHVAELTGSTGEAVYGVAPSRDGWTVTLEVVELERVPRTTDILATYLVEVDEDGELLRYERVARYYRNQAGGNGGGDDA